TSIGYRLPSILAKMAATLDTVSNGRLTLGIGAGWYKKEYVAYGIPFPPFRTRLEQLEEGIQVLRAMWTQEKPCFNGKHYQIKNAYCNPKPLQKPLPILIGGNNEEFLLPLAGKYADVYNALWVTPEKCRIKFKLLEKHERAAGREKGAVKRTYFTNIFLVDSASEVTDIVNTYWSSKNGQSKEEWASSRLIGTKQQIIKQIETYQKAGVEELILLFGDKGPGFPQMIQFAKDILPSF
ncbi:MAG: LLM class flavin-dependent oxidoreductase, partial [Candidatus Ranarchaeia archaeon]